MITLNCRKIRFVAIYGPGMRSARREKKRETVEKIRAILSKAPFKY